MTTPDTIPWCFRRLGAAVLAATLALVLAAALQPGPARAQGAPLAPVQPVAGEMVVPVNKSQVLRVDRPVRDIRVGNPEIADVVPLSDRSVYVLGKQIGSTSLSIYDRNQAPIAVVDLVVSHDIEGLKARLSEVLGPEPIEVRPVGDSIVLTGTVSSAAQAQRAIALAERFAPQKVGNLLRVRGSQQVLLSVRFVEMQRSVVRELGLRSLDVAAVGGDLVRPPVPGATVSPTALLGGAFAFLDGRFALSAALDALENKGLVRTLAEPNLIAMSGDTANFLAGGEFPIPVSQDSDDGGSTITIEFKEFGVSLAFTPTVLDDGLINLMVSPEVSAIDPNNSIVLEGLRIPGLTTRRATTTVELRDGESFAIAGLLQSDLQDTIRQVPGLGDIPILGALFKSVSYQRRETELVIIVSPRIVEPTAVSSLATPDQGFVPPSFADLYFLGRMSGSGAESGPANMLGASSQGGIAGPYGHIIR